MARTASGAKLIRSAAADSRARRLLRRLGRAIADAPFAEDVGGAVRVVSELAAQTCHDQLHDAPGPRAQGDGRWGNQGATAGGAQQRPVGDNGQADFRRRYRDRPTGHSGLRRAGRHLHGGRQNALRSGTRHRIGTVGALALVRRFLSVGRLHRRAGDPVVPAPPSPIGGLRFGSRLSLRLRGHFGRVLPRDRSERPNSHKTAPGRS